MSLHALAHGMASKGRGPDTMLVHMAPSEVAGLQALAKAHGGSLTTNPHTGLPEAGFLSSLLPTVIGAGLAATGVGAPLAAAMVGGGYGLMTGSLNKGLMAGLGAFGGYGLGGGLMAAGAEGVGAGTLGSAGAEMGAQTAAQAGAGLEATLAGQGITPVAGATGASAGAQTAAQLGQGFATGTGATPNPMSAVNQGVLNTISPGAMTTTPATLADQAVATTTPMASTPAPTPAAPAAPGYMDKLSQMGKGITNLGTEEGRTAFMSKEGVGGGSGLLKYGMASLMPGLLEPPKAAQYKGSGPNPYNYRYDVNRNPDPNAGFTGHPSAERQWFTPTYTQLPAMATGGLTAFADGGINDLGGYSDGGQLLRGPGDGVSDSIPATIGHKQPARLADGEFVVPARIVSELGNGSTEAGARKLYQMMDRVQKARGKTTGKNSVAVNSRADKALPV